MDCNNCKKRNEGNAQPSSSTINAPIVKRLSTLSNTPLSKITLFTYLIRDLGLTPQVINKEFNIVITKDVSLSQFLKMV